MSRTPRHERTLSATCWRRSSSRPALKWEFIVLDTDGVNAFAAPGGIVHITKGALGLIKSEAELAGVLGHEIAHITKKHTVNAIQKNKAIKMTTEEVGAKGSAYYSKLANAAYDNIVERGFDRGDEDDADQEGLRLANKAGLQPRRPWLLPRQADGAQQGAERHQAERAVLTHPDTQARIDSRANRSRRRSWRARPWGRRAMRPTSATTRSRGPLSP